MLDIFDDKNYPWDDHSRSYQSNEVFWEDQVLYWQIDCISFQNFRFLED